MPPCSSWCPLKKVDRSDPGPGCPLLSSELRESPSVTMAKAAGPCWLSPPHPKRGSTSPRGRDRVRTELLSFSWPRRGGDSAGRCQPGPGAGGEHWRVCQNYNGLPRMPSVTARVACSGTRLGSVKMLVDALSWRREFRTAGETETEVPAEVRAEVQVWTGRTGGQWPVLPGTLAPATLGRGVVEGPWGLGRLESLVPPGLGRQELTYLVGEQAGSSTDPARPARSGGGYAGLLWTPSH